jgi:hypothetical protein
MISNTFANDDPKLAYFFSMAVKCQSFNVRQEIISESERGVVKNNFMQNGLYVVENVLNYIFLYVQYSVCSCHALATTLVLLRLALDCLLKAGRGNPCQAHHYDYD